MKSPDNLELNVINDFYRLSFLHCEWLLLYNRCPNSSPFQSPDWLLPWWKYFGNDHQLNVLEIRRNKLLCGLAPFYICLHPDSGQRELKFIGTGNSDYLDLLIENEMTVPCMELIFNYLIENKTVYDVCYMYGLHEKSLLVNVPFPNELERVFVETEICPVLYLPDSADEIDILISRNFHKHMKRMKRILDEAGILELEMADENNVNIYLNELFLLHKDRWGLKNKPGVLGEEKIQAFHHDTVHNLIANSSVKLYRLLHNNETVALLYILVKNKTMYNYIGAFNPAYKNFSPGSILLYAVLEDCIESGYKEFNMLNGAEDYKYRWGAQDKLNFTIMIKHK